MNISKNIYCIGCNACRLICPVNAINMSLDIEGFLRAVVNNDKCLECGKCNKVCPMIKENVHKNKVIKSYAVINHNIDTVARSSSGGVFTELAEYILNTKGTVYGCIMNKDFSVVHSRLSNLKFIDRMRRSKYVQSDTKDTYYQVKCDLERGLNVLYTGTPCQISGLKLYLGKEYSNLYCADLICHGVPSNKLFQQSVNYYEKNGKKVVKYEFRLKPKIKKFYYSLTLVLLLPNGNKRKMIKPYYMDPYYEAFVNCKSYSEACYKCNYACNSRVGDITIGDYNHIEKYHPDIVKKMYDNKSVSAVMINTDKGERLFEKICSSMEIVPTKFHWIAQNNRNLSKPSIRPDDRTNIYSEINNKGYNKWANKYYYSLSFIKNTIFYKKISEFFN